MADSESEYATANIAYEVCARSLVKLHPRFHASVNPYLSERFLDKPLARRHVAKVQMKCVPPAAVVPTSVAVNQPPKEMREHIGGKRGEYHAPRFVGVKAVNVSKLLKDTPTIEPDLLAPRIVVDAQLGTDNALYFVDRVRILIANRDIGAALAGNAAIPEEQTKKPSRFKSKGMKGKCHGNLAAAVSIKPPRLSGRPSGYAILLEPTVDGWCWNMGKHRNLLYPFAGQVEASYQRTHIPIIEQSGTGG